MVRKDEKMPRHGENIRKRADGRWEGRYILYIPGKGKQQRSVYGKTYAEVKKKKSEAMEAANNYMLNNNKDIFIKSDVLFGEVMDEWLIKIRKTKKYSTYIKYSYIYETYLKDTLSAYPINNIEIDNIQDILAGKEADCSESIKKSIYSVIYGVLNYGIDNYNISPIKLKRKPFPSKKKKLVIYSHTEQATLLRYLYKDMDIKKMGIVLCLSTGLRLGEACALKWDDIDFQNKVLNVNRTVQRISVNNQITKTALYEGEPKTSCSKREIPLSDEIIYLLTKFRHSGRYVLNDRSPLEPRTYQYKFQNYQKQAGVVCKNFHVLRHTFATNCVGNGVDVKSLSEILGHSNVQITLNKYVHPTLDTKRQHMNTLSSIYGQIVGHIN